MRATTWICTALLLGACAAPDGAATTAPIGAVVPPLAPAPGGGGGGGTIDVGAIDRPPGGRTTEAACPVDFADALEEAIAAVPDRPAHDALEVQRLNLARLGGASYSARLSTVSRLQALAQRLALNGDLAPDQAARIADLAPCYLE